MCTPQVPSESLPSKIFKKRWFSDGGNCKQYDFQNVYPFFGFLSTVKLSIYKLNKKGCINSFQFRRSNNEVDCCFNLDGKFRLWSIILFSTFFHVLQLDKYDNNFRNSTPIINF